MTITMTMAMTMTMPIRMVTTTSMTMTTPIRMATAMATAMLMTPVMAHTKILIQQSIIKITSMMMVVAMVMAMTTVMAMTLHASNYLPTNKCSKLKKQITIQTKADNSPIQIQTHHQHTLHLLQASKRKKHQKTLKIQHKSKFPKTNVTTIGPWIANIWCQTNFPGHRGPTKTINTYPLTNWRADITNDCRDSEQKAKTSPKCQTIPFTPVFAPRPRARRILLGRKTRSVSTNQIEKIHIVPIFPGTTAQPKAPTNFKEKNWRTDMKIHRADPLEMSQHIMIFHDFDFVILAGSTPSLQCLAPRSIALRYGYRLYKPLNG